MLKIDDSLLQDIGLGSLPASEKNSLLKHVYETLEMRVGMRLADQMTNEQLDEFERYFEAKDDAGAFKWLETNFPNYKEIVQQEFDKLKSEVGKSAPQILAAASSSPTPTGAPAPMPMPTEPLSVQTPVQQTPQPTAQPAPVQSPAPIPMPMQAMPTEPTSLTSPAPMTPPEPPTEPIMPTFSSDGQPPAGPGSASQNI